MTDATRKLLEQHFDTAFAAPDGIAKLRELILTLAMQGKLVAQDPNDPPASELLKEIEKEKVSREGAKREREEAVAHQGGGSALRAAAGVGVGEVGRNRYNQPSQ